MHVHKSELEVRQGSVLRPLPFLIQPLQVNYVCLLLLNTILHPTRLMNFKALSRAKMGRP